MHIRSVANRQQCSRAVVTIPHREDFVSRPVSHALGRIRVRFSIAWKDASVVIHQLSLALPRVAPMCSATDSVADAKRQVPVTTTHVWNSVWVTIQTLTAPVVVYVRSSSRGVQVVAEYSGDAS